MPPLSISWLRGGLLDAASTPAQRAVRVLQVTQANWHVLPGGRRRRHRGGMQATPLSMGKERFAS